MEMVILTYLYRVVIRITEITCLESFVHPQMLESNPFIKCTAELRPCRGPSLKPGCCFFFGGGVPSSPVWRGGWSRDHQGSLAALRFEMHLELSETLWNDTDHRLDRCTVQAEYPGVEPLREKGRVKP